ncbi:MAG: hypothetical protein INQ03_09675 [Candidatus Heimdallarchaeota archaeon]|nr:hypothetical protein [Candidatus Heimdallarchaeota archaeon]
MSSQEELFSISTNDSIPWGDRYSAIHGLNGEELLIRVSELALDPDIRMATVEKISN